MKAEESLLHLIARKKPEEHSTIRLKDVLHNLPDDSLEDLRAKIIGIGGAGVNVASRIYEQKIKGRKNRIKEIQVLNIDSDKDHLESSKANKKILVSLGDGRRYLRGSRKPTKNDLDTIRSIVKNTDIVFIICGLGGYTGTNFTALMVEQAKSVGAIVAVIAILPFAMESKRVEKSKFSIECLRKTCDTLILIDNNKLLEIASDLNIIQAFKIVDELIMNVVKDILESTCNSYFVSLNLADIKAFLSNCVVASVGVGESEGNNRASEAADIALKNQFLDFKGNKAINAIVLVAGGEDLTLNEVSKVAEVVTESLDRDAIIIWGAKIDKNLGKFMRVICISGGIKDWRYV